MHHVTDGKGTFGEQQVITTEADVAISVFAVDVDGDGAECCYQLATTFQ